MNCVQVLDCTLRDGGYCNNWLFGYRNIKKIISGLCDAGIDIIECGFISNKACDNKDSTKYIDFEAIRRVLPEKHEGKCYVAMINYGEYNIDDIPVYEGKSIDGVRVAFHKKDLTEALLFCSKIKEKGYKVFVQAMVSMSYTDNEFLNLIELVNRVDPYSFYIVDSFGVMKQKDLIRLFYMVEHNLKEDIWIGFHSHNNLQLSYSNAQKLSAIQTKRNLIIDASVYGMGRGAGNLNTELFIDYLNDVCDKSYKIQPLLMIIDEILGEIYRRTPWGYSLPNYLSAIHNVHPNYANFLDEKKTLTVEAMDNIFRQIEEDRAFEFNIDYINSLYENCMAETGDDKLPNINQFNGKEVMLIAPGMSAVTDKSKVIQYTEENDVSVVSINFDYPYVETDQIFVSNLRRFRDLDKECLSKCIITSNIKTLDKCAGRVDYSSLLNDVYPVKDNAGLMAIKFMISCDVKKLILVGFDGYSHDAALNYMSKNMEITMSVEYIDKINDAMREVLSRFMQDIEIEFLTIPMYYKI